MSEGHDRARLSRQDFLRLGATAAALAGGAGVAGAGSAMAQPGRAGGGGAVLNPGGIPGFYEPASRFFATAFVEYFDTLDTTSEGDLWPCAWADDGELYAPNGDGRGFDLSSTFDDIVMNKISGTPETGITGQRLAATDAIAPIWGDPARYNRKPTGIVAVDGNGDGRDELYMAVQDLRLGPGAFDDAPTASITRSTDYGRTWQPTTAPMFTDYVFTTIFFLDFGQSNRHAAVLGPDGDRYVYAYGLDNNWRDSFVNTVPDPTELYLARVPIGSIQDRSTWEFYTGTRGRQATWSTDTAQRRPVLTETRRVYPTLRGEGIRDMTVLSQGSVVYNAPLRRYIYTSWTEYTFEFYEAPAPWGPWKVFLRKDFGGYPWFGRPAPPGSPGPKNGGYATVVPSKFISADGRRMWVQCNWFVGVGSGEPNYNFSLRPIDVAPFTRTQPDNRPDPTNNLARTGAGVVPIEKSAHYGKGAFYNDGVLDHSEDSFDFEDKLVDFWGFLWPRTYRFDRVVYTTGQMFVDGGWFDDVRVQVRRDFVWRDVRATVTPAYPADASAGPNRTFTFAFNDEVGDGVRIIGRPGGPGRFTSIGELEVYYDALGNRRRP